MEPSASRAGVTHAVLAAMDVRGLSEQMLADAAGIPLQTLRARLGARSPFTLDELARVAKVLGLSPADLINRTGDPT